MTTRFIGLKEFRQNMAKISADVCKRRQRLIILRKNRPLFELRPLSKKEEIMEKLLHDIEEAEEDVRKGYVYSLEEVEKHLGL